MNGDENFSYSAAIIIADEVENDTFAADIMASMKISDNGRLNLAYFDTERSAGNQFTAALQIAGFNGVLEYQPDRYGDDANINLTLGYSLPVSDSMTFNAQLGMNDVGDNSDDDQTPMRYTLGVDQQLAKNVTAYALLDVDSLDNDAANEEETTVAAGIKVNF
ncbi:MAG: hypothetical protein CSA54_01520 [Gammaproteobacteria bacterium]|nr:MAG: hypothetical protein CSA54_01520 [Gammaproteobacteria bacterium]